MSTPRDWRALLAQPFRADALIPTAFLHQLDTLHALLPLDIPTSGSESSRQYAMERWLLDGCARGIVTAEERRHLTALLRVAIAGVLDPRYAWLTRGVLPPPIWTDE